ncbi:MAG: SPASM domain-containing protein, partial [Psychrosphaera sp.]|nr:SPASM domain-containing protein [Psychrosphaera sp.]
HQTDPALAKFLDETEQSLGVAIGDKPAQAQEVRAISLNVAQHCNLGCHYCYADEGKFGADAQLMPQDVAFAAVDKLIEQCPAGEDVIIGFMGGEPMLNRKLIRQVTEYTSEQARQHGAHAKFSITTNATLLSQNDAKFFAKYGFQVTVSLDGPKEVNDKLRPNAKGGSSYDALVRGIKWLRQHPPGHLSGRITVTPQTPRLLPLLQHVVAMGFDDVGFAPVLVSPDPDFEFQADDFTRFALQMRECGAYALSQLKLGKRFAFSNFETALNELHRGSHRPYPCGAGAGYLSVSAKGDFYACHRLIDLPQWHMGDLQNGFNNERRQQHLNNSFVDKQTPCKNCWARYLCGGGCHHEVEKRGRPGCDYIRSWLEFCLGAYSELSTSHPDYFVTPQQFFNAAQASNTGPQDVNAKMEQFL